MNKTSFVITAVSIASIFFSTSAHAVQLVYSANLNGPNEATPNASPGSGTAQVTYDDVAHTLLVQSTFSGLLGNVTAAHIHAATSSPGSGTAGVATPTPTFPGFPSGVTSGTYNQTFDLTLTSSYNPAFITANGGTTSGAEAALTASLAAGTAYFNIHTNVFPGGEIRGFLSATATAVPFEFSPSLGLVALGGIFGANKLKKKVALSKSNKLEA